MLQDIKEKKINVHENHRERVKERFFIEGLDNFEPHNALEMALFFVLPHVDTNEIAHNLINQFGSISGVFDAPYEELIKVKGIKKQAALFLKFIPAICRYYMKDKSEGLNGNISYSYEDIANLVSKQFVGETNETVVVSLFDTKMRLINTFVAFRGSVNSVNFQLKEIFSLCNKYNCTKIVIAHNHPSGSCIPSDEDINSTQKIMTFLNYVDIELVEHFVVDDKNAIGILNFTNINNLSN